MIIVLSTILVCDSAQQQNLKASPVSGQQTGHCSPSPLEHTVHAVPHWLSYTPQAGLMWGVLRGTCALQCHWGEDWGCWCPQELISPLEEEVQGKRWTGWAVRKVMHVTSAALAAAVDVARSLLLLLPLQLLVLLQSTYTPKTVAANTTHTFTVQLLQ